ncbi:hypothetical protein [Spirosoma validum]|uniref:hypothetical protein n=1 Tax=Spirosoma validum TaxID=2771355 RepID=UPI00168AF742|nr:hypothetical protein [Spirosoma validum]
MVANYEEFLLQACTACFAQSLNPLQDKPESIKVAELVMSIFDVAVCFYVTESGLWLPVLIVKPILL